MAPSSSAGLPQESLSDVPARSLAGPSRTRNEARQMRTSLGKPYARSSLGTTTGGKGTSQRQTQYGDASSSSPIPNVSQSTRSPATSEKSQTGSAAAGLFSGLRQAIISRPLSWLQRGAPRSESLQTSRSSSSLASSGQRTAAQRLSDSVQSTAQATSGDGSGRLNSRPSAFVAPPPSTPSRSPFTSSATLPSRSNQFGFTSGTPAPDMPSAQAPRSPSAGRSSASAIIRSHGRQRLSVEPSSPYMGGSVLGTPGFRRAGSQRGEGSASGLSQANSSASFAYGFGSERRLGGLGSSASMHAGMSQSPLASSSYGRLPSRSPFAVQRRSLGAGLTPGSGLGGVAASEMGSLRASPRAAHGMGLVTTPSRPVSMFGGDGHRSRAGSVAGSASSRNNTPKRREWSSLKLAPPSAQRSEGEELMREYLSMRDAAATPMGASPGMIHPALHDGPGISNTQMTDFGPSMENMSRHGESLKREASMSVDGDAVMSDIQPRKRRMVWDPEMGFISRQEQRARQAPRPVANNEAERLLNALEGMRTPLGDARRDASARSTTPSRSMINVPVPLAAMGSDSPYRHGEHTKAVSPYYRAMRRSKLSQSVEPEPGLRSRLRRTQPATPSASSSRRREDDEMSEGSSRRAAAEEDEAEDEEDEEEEKGESHIADDEEMSSEQGDEAVVEPPRRRLGLSTQSKAKQSEENVQQGKSAEVETSRTLRSGKVLPIPSSPPKKVDKSLPATPVSTSKPMSRARIGFSVNGISAANKQRAERQLFGDAPSSTPVKDNFSVKMSDSNGTDQQTRSRSSLRQGAEKTSRTHTRSGRIGMDDEADEDNSMNDSPSTDELSKIKLPANLFPKNFTFSNASGTNASAANLPNVSPSIPTKPLEGTSTSAATQGQKALPAPADDAGEDGGDRGKAGESSLLSRMGGFAPQQASTQSSAGKTDVHSSPFSFGMPSDGASQSAAPTSRPLFSFQPSVSSPLAEAGSSKPSTTSAASSSSFFSAPAGGENKNADASSTTVPERKEGPVPNFFASSLAKSGQQTEPSPPTFSFGSPSSTSAAADAPKPAFSFDKPLGLTNGPTQASLEAKSDEKKEDSGLNVNKPSFSFGIPGQGASPTLSSTATSAAAPSPFGGIGKPVETNNANTTKSAPLGGFVSSQHSSTGGATAPTPSFSFGTTSNSTALPSSAASQPIFAEQTDAGKKRGADDDTDNGTGEPQQKKGFTGFGNGAASASSPFSFSGSTNSPASSTTPANATGFSFNASHASEAKEKKTSTPSFSFGTPGTGSADAASVAADKPAFSFGAGNTASNTSKGNSGPMTNAGQSGSNNGTGGGFGGFGAATPSGAAAMPSKPTFSFGSPSSTALSASQAAPASTGFSFDPKSSTTMPAAPQQPQQRQPTFSFGQQNTGNNNSAGAPSSPFGQPSTLPFGTTSSQPGSANPFGSQDSSRQGSPAPFTFGAPSNAAASSQPGTFGFGQQASAGSGASTANFSFGSQSQQPPSTSTAQAGAPGMSFSFSVPMAGSSPAPAFGTAPMQGGGSGSGPGTPPPFVFGTPSGGAPTNGAPISGSFPFGAPGTGGATTPQPQQGGAPQGNSLFNIGGPSSSPAGNRPVRGMPSRRKKA